jgi:hypothetical protein
MNVQDVEARVKAIEAVLDDPEGAHIDEDELHSNVLYYISTADIPRKDMRLLAQAALKTHALDMTRWYA